MGTFGDSWQLTKTSFRTIKEDKALLLFPLVAGLAALGILAMLAVGLFSVVFWAKLAGTPFDLVVGALLIAAYYALWIVSVYFTGALVGAARLKLDGGQPTFADGMKAARAHAGKLILWGVIAASIMLVIRVISARFRGITGWIIGLAAGAAWGVVTYFLVPVLMFEEQTAWGSLKRSANLYLHHFGRTVVSNLAMGLLLGLGFVAAIALGGLAVWVLFSISLALGLVLLMSALALGVFMVILASAAEGVLTVALYRYATTGKLVPGLIPPTFQGAVAPGRGGLYYSSPPPPSSRPLP